VLLVKYWAKRRKVNDAYVGTLSSYAYALMCIAHLQRRLPPVLPVLHEMPPTHVKTVGELRKGVVLKLEGKLIFRKVSLRIARSIWGVVSVLLSKETISALCMVRQTIKLSLNIPVKTTHQTVLWHCGVAQLIRPLSFERPKSSWKHADTCTQLYSGVTDKAVSLVVGSHLKGYLFSYMLSCPSVTFRAT
jgi:hypothetical protein